MSAPVFFAARELLGAETVRIDGPEARHAATVRRVTPGERIVLTDGHGLVATCVVTAAHRDHLDLVVEERREVPPPEPRLVVVQALPKGDRGELAVELMTEVGVDAIIPWAASRCISRWKDDRPDRAQRSLDKWRAAAREATKQARRAWVPEVSALHTTADVAAVLGAATLPVVLHEAAHDPLAALDVPHAGDVVLVVGPEGGVAPDELSAFERAGARVYRLGDTVLRTSTAGTAAAAVVLSRTNRWC